MAQPGKGSNSAMHEDDAGLENLPSGKTARPHSLPPKTLRLVPMSMCCCATRLEYPNQSPLPRMVRTRCYQEK